MDDGLVRRYQSAEGARGYRGKYERSLLRRLSNRRELAVVDAALRQAAPRGPVLDCPVGAGRLVPVLLRHAEHVTGADLSAAMVDEARDALAGLVVAGRVELVAAPAHALPFPDRAFDTVVCHRLLHHVPDARERAAILAELARVAGRRVVLSFSDATTRKARSQVRRGRTRRRHVLSPDDLAREAAPHGLRIQPPIRHLNGLLSVVAVAVLLRDGAA